MISKRDLKYATKITSATGEIVYVIKRPSGFGDTVEHFLHTGIIGKMVHTITGLNGPCEGCKKRRDALNKLIPYEVSKNV